MFDPFHPSSISLTHLSSFCAEMPLEEWIEWVEKNRLKEMTPEQKVEYEHKKKLRADALREKEEQRRREEEEKLRKARQKMSDEQRYGMGGQGKRRC